MYRNDITKSRVLKIIQDFNARDGFITFAYVAKELFCDRETAKKHIGLYEATRKAFISKQEERYDAAEEMMFEMARENFQALKYVLSSKVRSRGWGIDLSTLTENAENDIFGMDDKKQTNGGMAILSSDEITQIEAIINKTQTVDTDFEEIEPQKEVKALKRTV